MNGKVKLSLLGGIVAAIFFAASCHRRFVSYPAADKPTLIIHAVSYVKIAIPEPLRLAIAGDLPQNQTVTVVNNAASTMTLAPFPQPSPINPHETIGKVELGSLAVSSLYDNDLRHCPKKANKKCGTAGIRLTMLDESGLSNDSDPTEILPMFSGTKMLSTTPLVMQTYSIPLLKQVIRHGDFQPAPQYPIQLDLTEAGAGTFKGTIVVEYFITD